MNIGIRILDMLRARWSDATVRFGAYACLTLLIGLSVGLGAALRSPSSPDGYAIKAQTITPIADWASTGPVELGGSTTGSFITSADRIVIKARTASGTATLWLAQWDPATSKWWPYGPSCDLDAGANDGRNLCRWVAQRGTTYWHVMRSSGSTSEAWIESINEPAGGF